MSTHSQARNYMLVFANDTLDMHQLWQRIQAYQLQHQPAASGKVLFSDVSRWIPGSKHRQNSEACACGPSNWLSRLDRQQIANGLRKCQISRQNSVCSSHNLAAQERSGSRRFATGSYLRKQILLQSCPFAGGHGTRKFTGFDLKQHGSAAFSEARLPEMCRAIQLQSSGEKILQAM